MRRSDRIIGIVLGLIIGVVAVLLFVFVWSNETIDAPALDDGASTELETTAPEAGSEPRP